MTIHGEGPEQIKIEKNYETTLLAPIISNYVFFLRIVDIICMYISTSYGTKSFHDSACLELKDKIWCYKTLLMRHFLGLFTQLTKIIGFAHIKYQDVQKKNYSKCLDISKIFCQSGRSICSIFENKIPDRKSTRLNSSHPV